MEIRSLMSLGNGANPPGRIKTLRLAHLSARSQVINERRPTMASMSVGLLVSEAAERRWVRSSLACWRLEAQIERPVHPLSVAALPM